jgi:hypothetical protein
MTVYFVEPANQWRALFEVRAALALNTAISTIGDALTTPGITRVSQPSGEDGP